MDISTDCPRLRHLDFKPVDYDGMQYLYLRDPLNLAERNLLVPEPYIPVLPLLDGTRDIKKIQFALLIRNNLRLSFQRLQEIITALDDACLLENETYHVARKSAFDEYRASAYRLSPLAGNSYPNTPEALNEYLSQFLHAAGVALDGADRPDYLGLLSPHIDFARGGQVYAHTWAAATRAVLAAELVVILGTDHFSEGYPISLTRQPYATPFGPLPLPNELLNKLERTLGEDEAYAGELHHRSEHSIDLTSVWLHFVRGGKPVDTLPILVGDLDLLPPDRLDQLVKILRKETRRHRTLIVVAGDMAHVGPAFGGKPVSRSALEILRAEDERVLTALDGGAADAIQAELQALAGNNVCGANLLYLAARILGPLRIDRLGYAACPADEENTSFVTIAGAGLY